MPSTVAVVGATGHLGGLVIAALLGRSASVIALVRPGTAASKLSKLQQPNVRVVEVDVTDEAAVARAVSGAVCVVSCLVGLRDVVVGVQTALLQGCVAAGVPRFIPSDYSMDFTRLPPGSNRNLDNRRDFHAVLAQSTVQWTSVLTGVFSSVLGFDHSPLLQLRTRTVPYVQSADQAVDISYEDDVAEFTAAAALDPSAPHYLRIASCSATPRDLHRLAEEVWGERFELVSRGSLEELKTAIEHTRASEGEEGERQLYPMSQILQYAWSMFSGLGNTGAQDNGRYPEVQWTGIEAIFRAKRAAGQ